MAILAYGSNFEDGTGINWNGTAIATTCVDINLIPTSCSGAVALTATVPAADFAAVGTAKVTLSNPANAGSSGGTSNPVVFNINQAAGGGSNWARAVPGISTPNDVAWDALHGKLYVSVSSTDTTNANTIAVIDPVAGSATSFVPAGINPDQLSISSDSGYLWAGLDGSNSVQRFLLPGLSKDISFPVPTNYQGQPLLPTALQAAPVSPHTVALIAGHGLEEEGGNGVYIYDDATARPNSVPGLTAAGPGPDIDWIRWGADDTTIYGNPIYAAGIAIMNVGSSGVTLSSYNSGRFLPSSAFTQFDGSNGLLYSYGGAFDPAKLSMNGSFDLPETGAEACTADSGVDRYYCVTAYSPTGLNVFAVELWVFDLNSYSLLNRIALGSDFFDSTADNPLASIVTGRPLRLVRWGNAGLAVLTATDINLGNGGIFLIDGTAVNPSAPPDTTVGRGNASYAWLSSISPDSATTTSGEAEVTIKGNGFTSDSTACWNCSALQSRFLPTTYVNSTQLTVTIPLASVSSAVPLEISVFDQSSDLFSSNALTFTVFPNSGATQVTPVNLCGLAMAWDANSQLLYVGTADYDPSYPNAIVAVDPTTATVVKSQTVEPDPIFLSDSANGQYLYAAYNGATNLTQLALPGLNTTVTAPLQNAQGGALVPGDLKAAPQNPHTVAATLIVPGYHPEALGGVVVFDDGVPRPISQPGWTGGQTVPAIYDTLAWSASDQLLTSAPSTWDDDMTGPLYSLQVDSSGVSYLTEGTALFDTGGGYIHSDFGTNLIYSDGGSVADPSTGAIVGSYAASGLVAPDSSLNRVFILGQTAAQANTPNFTIESFDQKAFTPVSSITLNNLSGSPIALARWGKAGLAVLTTGGLSDILVNGMGMLYIVQDAAFVSSAQATRNVEDAATERVQQRWRRMTTRDWLVQAHRAMYSR